MKQRGFMKRAWLVCLVVVFSAMAGAQNCDQVVYDGANVLNGREREVEQVAYELIKEGADVRVRTVPSLVNGNLDFNEKAYEQNCPSWRSPNGLRKNNLVSFMVAPQQRKMGLYYGSDYHTALDNIYSDIKKSMGGDFKNGEWAQGFMTGEKGVVGAIDSQKAYVQAKKDEALHPHPATVNNIQATDYSGLWTVLKWILGLGVVAFLVGLAVSLFKRRSVVKEELDSAQAAAVDYKNRVGQRINRIDSAKLSPVDKRIFDTLVDQYSEACGRIKSDPSVDGQTLAAYNTQLGFYRNLYNDLVKLEAPSHSEMADIDSKKPDVPKIRYSRHVAQPQRRPEPERASEPAVRERTVVVQPSNDGFVEGALLGSLLGHDSDRGSSGRDEEEERSEVGAVMTMMIPAPPVAVVLVASTSGRRRRFQ